MSEAPHWRRVFDRVEREVTPRVESVVHGEEFARAMTVVSRARAGVRRRIEDTSARLWHLVNLPAGSDVRRLRRQVGELDREIRRLTLRLAQQDTAEDAPDDTTSDNS